MCSIECPIAIIIFWHIMLRPLPSARIVYAAAAAHLRLITGTRRCEHITPVLQKLHWLSVRQSVEFKLACLVHKSLVEQTPSYLASDIQLTTNTGRPQLRSASERTCVVPCAHNSFRDRSFSAAGPHVWNALPSYLWQHMNYTATSSMH